MQMFAIGEIARQTQVATSTIRYYERIGLLPAAKRVNGRRRYDAAILPKLRVIRLAQRAGFTIAEIQTLLHEFPADTPPATRWQALAGTKLVELDELLNEVQRKQHTLEQTLLCRCSSLEECAGNEQGLVFGD
jgi:MerR family redox-sensitive transcriptional activator SoxR